MASDDTKLAASSRELVTMGAKAHDFRLPAASTWKCGHGLMSVSLRFRHLHVVGIAFVIVMGLLSSSYLETYSRIRVKRKFGPPQVNSLVKAYGTIDVKASDRPLKIPEEDFVLHASLTSNLMTSSEAAQEGELGIEQRNRDPQTSKIWKDNGVVSSLLAGNSIGDDKQGNDGLSMPLVEQYDTQLGEEDVTSDIDEDTVKEGLMVPVAQQVQTQQRLEETWPIDKSTTNSSGIEGARTLEQEILPDDLQQDGQPSVTGKDKETTDSNEAQSRFRKPFDSSERTSNSSISSTGECDVTVGKWVHEPAGPLYRSDQCSILSGPQNCQRNGRPDHDYEYYTWKPDQCSIPRFDPNAFLEFMRGKTLAFVGDSLARNQMESLMCILLQAAEAVSKGRKGMHKWYFPSHNFTVIRVWSSWLVQTKGDFPPSIAPSEVAKLNLTELDDIYAEYLPTFDVTILSSGHWWTRKTAYFMDGRILGGMGWPWPTASSDEMELDLKKAFEIAWNTALRKVSTYPGYKGLTILRTYTPDHYSGGSWDNGGSCTGETKPYDEAPTNNFNDLLREKQLKAFKINTDSLSGGGIMPNGSKLRLLDVYPILNYRGDGHPGPYRNTDPVKEITRDKKGRPHRQDCLHWCMPGPLDTVNELLFHLLRKEMQ